MSLPLSSAVWCVTYLTLLLVLIFAVAIPVYTLILAATAYFRQCGIFKSTNSIEAHPWSNTITSIFRGSVYHIRHKPTVHSFSYPLFFSVVDLDEGNELFGNDVYTKNGAARGRLWPLSTLMMLRDIDHLKNGEGSPGATQLSIKERLGNLIHERTNGKIDWRSSLKDGGERKVLLVTHLMYYGYCFNPVSFYFVLKPTTCMQNKGTEIEAIVAEVSNTPWNEMSIYVLHPDSVDVTECSVTSSSDKDFPSPSYRYKFRKNFHVSPFMTMDHDYDWTFRITYDRIQVVTKMIKRQQPEKDGVNTDGELYFTAGFDITRTAPTKYFPVQLATIICRFPVYCFIIQIWIHYEALKLLMKGVQFIPHPEGSETGASKVIATVMAPVFAVKDLVEKRWKSKNE